MQASLEFIDFTSEFLRQAISELFKVLTDQRYLRQPAVLIHTKQLLQIGSRDIQSLRVEVVGVGQATNGRVLGMNSVIATIENPFQNPTIFSVPGPQIPSVLILPEPVYV